MVSILFRRFSLPVLCTLGLLIGLGVGSLATRLILSRRHAGTDVVATVQGVPITTTAFFRKLEMTTGRDAMAKLSTDALALKFAESLGAIPPAAEVEARVRQQRFLPGRTEFEAKHHLTDDDVRQIYRLELARAAAVRACNEGFETNTTDNPGVMTPTGIQPLGANYVKRFSEFRKNAKIEVFAKQFKGVITGNEQ